MKAWGSCVLMPSLDYGTTPTFNSKWDNKWDNIEDKRPPSLENQGLSNFFTEKYGLKAARRAPQFSKRWFYSICSSKARNPPDFGLFLFPEFVWICPKGNEIIGDNAVTIKSKSPISTPDETILVTIFCYFRRLSHSLLRIYICHN